MMKFERNKWIKIKIKDQKTMSTKQRILDYSSNEIDSENVKKVIEWLIFLLKINLLLIRYEKIRIKKYLSEIKRIFW
jgi:hypothetical protein